MDKLIIASTSRNAGKTGIIIGMAKILGKDFGYLKPFGDRLYYRKKRLWDYDSALMTGAFELGENPEDMSIGFEHTKVRYMYTEETIKDKLSDMVADIGEEKEIIFIEGPQSLSYGSFVHLDALSVAKYVGGKMVVVVSGSEGSVMDDLAFIKKSVDMTGIDFRGVIINKVQDVQDFKDSYLGDIERMGVTVIGILPYQSELTSLSVSNLTERFFMKVIAGEGGLNRVIEHVFIGAMHAEIALQEPIFKKNNKLIITGGDRDDMIIAALESNTSCVILTNNIVPGSNIIAKASAKNIPLLLVSEDTYQMARQIDHIEPVLTKDDQGKMTMIEDLVKSNIDISQI
jgi:BioD-like phosphotransacetylase family protein